LKRFAIYVFDYGAPVGFRLALAHPERINAIISQNGNAYLEGLSEGWNPIQAYWKSPTPENRAALRAFLTYDTTKWQYVHGTKDEMLVAPEAYALDAALMAARSVSGLRQQRRALSEIPGIFSHPPSAAAGGLGQERSVLPAARRGGFPARQSECGGAIL